jgi:hypothetical protein
LAAPIPAFFQSMLSVPITPSSVAADERIDGCANPAVCCPTPDFKVEMWTLPESARMRVGHRAQIQPFGRRLSRAYRTLTQMQIAKDVIFVIVDFDKQTRRPCFGFAAFPAIHNSYYNSRCCSQNRRSRIAMNINARMRLVLVRSLLEHAFAGINDPKVRYRPDHRLLRDATKADRAPTTTSRLRQSPRRANRRPPECDGATAAAYPPRHP